MPAPMIAPIPRVTRFRGPRARCSECSPVSSASARSAVMDFVAHRLIEAPFAAGRGATPARRMACTLGCAGARRQGGAAAASAGGCAGRRYNCREMGDLQTAQCRVLDGVVVGKAIRDDLAGRVVRVQQALGRPPALGIVLVGADPASEVYVRNKVRTGGESGLTVDLIRLPATASLEDVLGEVRRLNASAAHDGILVQSPLPAALGPARRDDRVRDHRSGQGRRRLQSGQRRAAGPEPRHAAIVHAGGRDGDAAPLGHPGRPAATPS